METATPSDFSFEQQFKNKEKLDFPEGRVRVVDIRPENPQGEIPVLLAPGWSENHDTYKKTLSTCFSSGRRAISLGYQTQRGGVIKSEEYPGAEFRKARLILNTLEKKGIDKADVIAHSEGAINVLIAAMINPSKFRNIVLDKPAGFIGKESKGELVRRFLKLMLQEAIARPPLLTDPTGSLRAGARTVRYIAENPKIILDEMDAITNFDITDLMIKLRDHGVMFSVISGVNDPLFPVRRQIQHMRRMRRKGKPPIPTEGYYSVIGGHNELSINKHNRHPKALDYYMKINEDGEKTRVKMDRKFPNSDKMHAVLALNALNGLQRRRELASH